MALLLCLGLTAALARGCLHCHGNFSEKFSFYRHHVNLKSWWVGDIPVSGSLLGDWSQDTMKELHLAIPAEISECGAPPGRAPCPAGPRPAPLTGLPLPPPARDKLDHVANAVYRKMDQLYLGKMYFPGKGAAAACARDADSTPQPSAGEPDLPPACSPQGTSLTSCEPSSGSRCTSSRMPSSKVSKGRARGAPRGFSEVPPKLQPRRRVAEAGVT